MCRSEMESPCTQSLARVISPCAFPNIFKTKAAMFCLSQDIVNNPAVTGGCRCVPRKYFFFFSFRTDSFVALAGLTKKCKALITPSRTLCFNFSCCRRWIGVPVGSSLTFVITPINQKLGSLKFVNVWTRQRRKEILKKNFRSVLLQGLSHFRFWCRLNSS